MTLAASDENERLVVTMDRNGIAKHLKSTRN
jgi:hypothetical protein